MEEPSRRTGDAATGEARGGPSTYDANYAGRFRARAGALWDDTVRFAAGLGPGPSHPHQVEIHVRQAGREGCPNRCVDCCGGFLQSAGGLPGETWVRLYEDLAGMGVPSVLLSGIHTDPGCLDPELLSRLIRMGGPAWGVKLYTYGLTLEGAVQRAVVEAAHAYPRSGSYVMLSLLTLDAGVMERMCRPRSVSAADALRRQEANLLSFFKLTAAEQAPLRVVLNCRLTRLNAGTAHLADLFRWFADHAPAPVRFRLTTDYLPFVAPAGYREWFFREIYLPADEARPRVAAAMAAAGLSDADRERISFRAVRPVPVHDVGRCLSRLLFAAVSPDGLVFPCPGVAGAPLKHLAYGDITHDRFPQIWTDFLRSYAAGDTDPVQAGCPHCAAECERQLCRALAAEVRAELRAEAEARAAAGNPDGLQPQGTWVSLAPVWVGSGSNLS